MRGRRGRRPIYEGLSAMFTAWMKGTGGEDERRGEDALDIGRVMQSGRELSRDDRVARVREITELEDLCACRSGLGGGSEAGGERPAFESGGAVGGGERGHVQCREVRHRC